MSSRAITYNTTSPGVATIIASLAFLLPGVSAVIIGVLTWFSLTWIENPANGLLLGISGLIWAAVGLGVLSFRRWVTVDGDNGMVLQGTRTVFKHPTDKQPLSSFSRIEVVKQQVSDDHHYYAVALAWIPQHRPRRYAHLDSLWLTTTASLDAARSEADRVAAATGKGVVDRTGEASA